MSTTDLVPERHRVIIAYLVIVFAFLVLGFAIWAYFDFKGLELEKQLLPATPQQHSN